MLTSAALCKGYGGLELAAEAILGPMEHLWYAENCPNASKVCAAHWPGVPNLGDLTAVDWTTVPPVDVLTAGYPCQPLSLVGRRAGMTDERWIWDDVFAAVRDLRPRLVLLENVAGHLSLGFGRVLGDLASAGFDAEWGCFRASDVGAPHRRERVFIAAWPSDCPPDAGQLARRVGVGAAAADGVNLLPTPKASDVKRNATAGEVARKSPALGAVSALLPTPRTSDTNGAGAHGTGGPDLRTVVSQMPTRWGAYAPAVKRWEQVTTRTAPNPTEPGGNGQPRLDPRFVEWLMGLPAGWVTDHLPRNPALKCLGNGVVWQQAAHAYTELLAAA